MGKGSDKKDCGEGTLSKRPWRCGATEVNMAGPCGVVKPCWTHAVFDANGNVVCCGETADMEFIVEMERSLDEMVRTMEAQGVSSAAFVKKFGRFLRKRHKD